MCLKLAPVYENFVYLQTSNSYSSKTIWYLNSILTKTFPGKFFMTKIFKITCGTHTHTLSFIYIDNVNYQIFIFYQCSMILCIKISVKTF